MDPMDVLNTKLKWMPPELAAVFEKQLKRFPAVRKLIDEEYSSMLEDLEAELKPYKADFQSYPQLPKQGLAHEEEIARLPEFYFREYFVSALSAPSLPENQNLVAKWIEYAGGPTKPVDTIDADNNVLICSYSDGPLGRIEGEDVVKLVNFYESQKSK